MKILFDNLKQTYLSDDPLTVHVKRYFVYQAVTWIFHLIVISLVSFFHLILNHSLGTIAEWINERGWQLIIFTKLSVMFLFIQFFSLKFQVSSKLKSFYQNGFMWPRTDFVVMAIFFTIALLSLGKPEINSAIIFELDNLILSYFGLIIFFSVDFIFLILLNANIPLPKDDRFKGALMHSFLFFLGTWVSFQYEFLNVNSSFFFLFFSLLYLSMWRRENWTLPFLFLFFVMSPISTFLGFDPVWQNQYSILRFSDSVKPFDINLLILICLLYLHFKKSQEPEYVYRD